MTDAGFSLKVSYGDQNRRFVVPELNYSNLVSLASDRFGCSPDGLIFQHMDCDGDLITITSTEELLEATKLLQGDATLRLVLTARDADADDDDVEEPSASECAESMTNLTLDAVTPPSKSEEKEKKRKHKKQKEEDKKREKREKSEKEKERIAKIVAEVLASQQQGAATSPAATAAPQAAPQPQAPTQTDAAPQPTQPTEEHLRGLLDAFIEVTGADKASIYESLNSLTPEKVRELDRKAPVVSSATCSRTPPASARAASAGAPSPSATARLAHSPPALPLLP
eukprot:CAMPEP_0181323060 /NCGR_PEP_ID=MMETSP1101-20121128/19573_1 /TAXON_ID=46948 /ORGANISM="Rhodomonas abbreviata, Strain Caron Lab Isolate" /LENGTH=282 /DNA_ID=CAMNT_0023431041 /DNA_START=146 /DNA_END=991 /DNA_ORIENTATION=+